MSAIKRPAVECSDCRGEHLKVRKRAIAGGGCQFRWQCTKCGQAIGHALPQKLILERKGREPPLFDEALADRWQGEKEAIRGTEQQQREAEREAARAEWEQWYAAYLTTPRWRAKRKAVMDRSGGRCEGCGKHRATEVHHLTYANAGDELLFQLVALCEFCHQKAHDPKPWREINPFPMGQPEGASA